MARTVLATAVSPAAEAAARTLAFLGVAEPPISPELVLDGLRLTTRSLPSFDLDRLTPAQLRQFGSVRGLLNPIDRTIYLRDDLPIRRGPWLVYHETGHATIEWHREVLYLDTDYTLGPRVIEQMEREANEFAGHLLFLGPRFADDAQQLPFGVASVLELAQRYDASIESAVRRYVETSPTACFCWVLQPAWTAEGLPTLKSHYFIKSKLRSAYWRFGQKIGELLPIADPLVRLYLEGKLDGGEVHERTSRDSKTGPTFRNEIFSTGLSVFVLAWQL